MSIQYSVLYDKSKSLGGIEQVKIRLLCAEINLKKNALFRIIQ